MEVVEVWDRGKGAGGVGSGVSVSESDVMGRRWAVVSVAVGGSGEEEGLTVAQGSLSEAWGGRKRRLDCSTEST